MNDDLAWVRPRSDGLGQHAVLPLPQTGGRTQRETGNREVCCAECVFRSRVSAVGYLVQVFRFGCRPRA